MQIHAIAARVFGHGGARSLVPHSSPSQAGSLPDPPRRRKWLVTVGLLGIAPALLSIDLLVIAVTTQGFAGDFRMELYPEARTVVRGINPFPPSDASFVYHQLIWPIPAAIVISPFTFLPVGAATAVFSCGLVLALLASLWIAGVRDWRVYGVVGVWPATLSGFQAGNITPLLALLTALAWRYRDRNLLPGVAIGAAVALKIFLWPLIVWLLATRRWAAAGAATASSCLVFLSVLPFISIGEYLRLMGHLSEAFGPQGFGPIGLLVQAGASLRVAEVLGYSIGIATLLLAWRRHSFQLALAASFLISPIVWLHYFTLLVVPIAIKAKSLGVLWLVPLGMWCCTEATRGSVAWQTGVALVCLAAVTVASEVPLRRRSGRLPLPMTA